MLMVALALFIGGWFVGSFLNVVVLRLHAGKSFVTGRSACPRCGHLLAPWELVPVISWVILRGRCRQCHKPISLQYPLVELATGAIFALAFLAQPPVTAVEWVVYVLWLYTLGSLVVLAVYDLRWYLLPDKVLLPLIIPAVAITVIEAVSAHSVHVAVGPIAAAVLFGGAFYAIAAFSQGRWMGGGDIKLAFVMGLLLGLQKTALAMFIAFDTAALVGVVLIGLRRKTRKDHIPFGPFLIAGTVVAYLYGGVIIDWYLRMSQLNLL